jgi:hypothetical protein
MADQQLAGASQTVEDLGRMVKQKYPQYESIENAQLGRMVKTKYPKAYGSFADIAAGNPPPPPSGPEQSAGNRFSSSLGQSVNPMPTVRLAGKMMDDIKKPGVGPILAAQDVYHGVVEPQVDMFKKSAEAFHEGKYMDWVSYSMAGVLPGAGPQIMHGYEQYQSGDRAGAAGTWVGTFLPFVAGKGLKAGVEKAASFAPSVYKGAIKFGEGVSLEERDQTTRRGLGKPEPAGAPPKSKTIANQAALKDLSKRIGKDHAEVLKRISKATASGIDIDRDYVLHPLDKLIDQLENSADPESAKPLRELRDNFRAKNPQFINPNRVQELKENTDKLLSDPSFSEDAKLKGKTGGYMAMRDGMREMLELVAPVQQLNWANHLDFQLADSINSALKSKPNIVYRTLPYIFTGASAVMMFEGHSKYAMTSLAMAAARAAMNSPAAMTRIATMLDEAGVKLPPVIGAATKGGAALGQAAISGKRKQELNSTVDDILGDLLGPLKGKE